MSRRLSADDWISAGIKALARNGFQVLKAEPLAKALGVSRGSFYWHFADVAIFHRAVIQRWQEVATEAIIAGIEHTGSGPERLRLLLHKALSAEAAMEIRMRAWAAADDAAAAAVAHVDGRRRAFLLRLLMESGVEPDLAATRAAILYWAYLGCTLAGSKPEGEQLGQAVEELYALGLGGQQEAP
jgi:AcrR family transcriptional regulator